MMKYTMIRVVLIGLALTLLPTERAWAWGNEGHEIVCRIAYLQLNSQEQAEIDRLTKLYRQPDGRKYQYFTDACTFADRARKGVQEKVPGWSYFSRFNRWHFLNVPRDTQEISANHCGDDCVLKGIEYHAARLANNQLEDWKRAESLFFLGHWVGDVHQPLHISYADDLGGNEIKPIKGGYYSPLHLHYVWDIGIISKALGNGGWLGYAAQLNSEIANENPSVLAKWRTATPLEWAQESYVLATTEEVDYCEWDSDDEGELCKPEEHTRHLTVMYQEEFQDDVEMRLKQAGVRLAEKIRLALGN
jgi:S1/P1 Nuclease